MRRVLFLIALAALAAPTAALATKPPQPGNPSTPATTTLPNGKTVAAQQCKAQRTSLGLATFKQTYGGKANAFAQCVLQTKAAAQSSVNNAAKQCKAERSDPNFAAGHDGKSFADFYGANTQAQGNGAKADAFGKCVSAKVKQTIDVQTTAVLKAAKQCKADRKTDAATFASHWGSGKNAFGKCVSSTSKTK